MHAYFPALNSFPSLLGDMLADAIGCLGFTWVRAFHLMKSTSWSNVCGVASRQGGKEVMTFRTFQLKNISRTYIQNFKLPHVFFVATRKPVPAFVRFCPSFCLPLQSLRYHFFIVCVCVCVCAVCVPQIIHCHFRNKQQTTRLHVDLVATSSGVEPCMH